MRVARPVEDRDRWFSLLALHQNRMPRGAGVVAKGYIKEQQLPACMDIVVWGHEHECLIGGGMGALPESAENEFVVLQPGSTVATRLLAVASTPTVLSTMYSSTLSASSCISRVIVASVLVAIRLRCYADVTGT